MKLILACIIAALVTGLTVRFFDNWLTELGVAVLIGAVTGLVALFLPQADDNRKEPPHA